MVGQGVIQGEVAVNRDGQQAADGDAEKEATMSPKVTSLVASD